MADDGAMLRSHLFAEISKSGRPRWLRVHELPCSRAFAYDLINSGIVTSVLVQLPGSKRGLRLVDADSLDSYLEALAAQQKTGKGVVKQEASV
jgi:hypothetical protein